MNALEPRLPGVGEIRFRGEAEDTAERLRPRDRGAVSVPVVLNGPRAGLHDRAQLFGRDDFEAAVRLAGAAVAEDAGAQVRLLHRQAVHVQQAACRLAHRVELDRLLIVRRSAVQAQPPDA